MSMHSFRCYRFFCLTSLDGRWFKNIIAAFMHFIPRSTNKSFTLNSFFYWTVLVTYHVRYVISCGNKLNHLCHYVPVHMNPSISLDCGFPSVHYIFLGWKVLVIRCLHPSPCTHNALLFLAPKCQHKQTNLSTVFVLSYIHSHFSFMEILLF